MAIHESLWQSVYLCLDEDPALLARHTTSTSVSAIDTFRCEEEAHPRRICTLIKECFGIIFTVEDIGRFTSISDMAAAILAELESTA
ncbi:hypothetical protein FRC03_011724 [Tulasnella sp. 419]|nr:hypothetical protein FRC03_011724 [Tulasnella sp. 419]